MSSSNFLPSFLDFFLHWIVSSCRHRLISCFAIFLPGMYALEPWLFWYFKSTVKFHLFELSRNKHLNKFGVQRFSSLAMIFYSYIFVSHCMYKFAFIQYDIKIFLEKMILVAITRYGLRLLHAFLIVRWKRREMLQFSGTRFARINLLTSVVRSWERRIFIQNSVRNERNPFFLSLSLALFLRICRFPPLLLCLRFPRWSLFLVDVDRTETWK